MNMWENVPSMAEHKTEITFYPAKNKISDAAVIVFAGGGYSFRAEHEGKGYGEFLSEHGYNAFVCDYRVYPDQFPLPLLDARRAVRYVRYYADKFGIDKNKVCVMGSSAGGGLVSLVSTCTIPFEGLEGVDDIDREDYIPNGQILCYPVITLENDDITHADSKQCLLSNGNIDKAPLITPEKNVKPNTPPAFIWHTAEDDCVEVLNSYMYASALRAANIPVEMHIFPYGGHGMGVATGNKHVSQWTGLLLNWLKLMF